MSVYFPLSSVHPRVWINRYPNPEYTNEPFYVKYPYYTNDMIYNYSPDPPFHYDYGLEEQCRCDVYHTMGECLAKQRYYHCP